MEKIEGYILMKQSYKIRPKFVEVTILLIIRPARLKF